MSRRSPSRRLHLSAIVLLLLAATTACQTIRPSGPPTSRTPVVFVHGWNGSETTWDAAVDHFRASGYSSGDITVVYYDSSLSAADAAAVLAAEVDHLRAYTGKPKVDIVSHSFGSMVTRYCITFGGCAGKVDQWMSLAGADNGTSIAGLCSFQPSCADMSGQTSTVADLAAGWPQLVAQGVDVAVQWTPNDGVILPATNSKNPAPAVNIEVSSSLAHLDLTVDPGVLTTTVSFLAG